MGLSNYREQIQANQILSDKPSCTFALTIVAGSIPAPGANLRIKTDTHKSNAKNHSGVVASDDEVCVCRFWFFITRVTQW